MTLSKWCRFVLVLVAGAGSTAVPSHGARAQAPDSSILRAGAAHVGLAPGQRIRYAVLNGRVLWTDTLRGIASDTLWLVSGQRTPIAAVTLLEVSSGKRSSSRQRARQGAAWGAAVGAVAGALLPFDSNGTGPRPKLLSKALGGALAGAAVGAYFNARARAGEEWRHVDLGRVHLAQTAPPVTNPKSMKQITRFIDSSSVRSALHIDSSTLIVVRARSSLPTFRWLGETPPAERVAAVFRRAGYPTLIAPVTGDTLGLGNDGLEDGHVRLALGLTGAVLGGLPAPRLEEMRAALAALRPEAPATGAPRSVLLAVCDHVTFEGLLAHPNHWECSVFDVMTGALIYAGGGEDSSAVRFTTQRALERALSGLLEARVTK